MATTRYRPEAALQAGQTYPSDLTDAEWGLVAPMLAQPAHYRGVRSTIDRRFVSSRRASGLRYEGTSRGQ